MLWWSAVPSYKQGLYEDLVELQVKSLLYVFKRLRINRIKSIPKTLDKYELVDPSLDCVKLDSSFNIDELIKVLMGDPHHILCDYIRNKFRSLCILCDVPVGTNSEPLPQLMDYKNRPVINYGFTILPLTNQTVDSISRTLSQSLIYTEHVLIGLEKRYIYAKTVVESVVLINSEKDTFDISKDQKAEIVAAYLKKLAIIVQTSRLYDEYTRQNGSQTSATTSPRKPSNVGVVKSTSSVSLSNSMRVLRPALESGLLGSVSPSRRLSSKPSISRLRLDELYNPVALPSPMVERERVDPEIWEKCKVAVQAKLDRASI